MKLRTKTHLIPAGVFCCLGLIIYLSVRLTLLSSFERIEQNVMRSNMERVTDAIETDVQSLDATARDWAWWTDTYSFMVDSSPEYVTGNLNVDSAVSLHVNFVALLNSQGKLVASSSVDLAGDRTVPLPDGLAEVLEHDPEVLSPKELQGGIAGILVLPRDTVLIAARQILTSARKGPSHGTLVMGRLLDENKIRELQRVTHLPLAIYPMNQTPFPEDVQRAATQLAREKLVLASPISTQILGGYALLHDIHGNPAVVVKSQLPREIMAQARTSSSLLAILLVLLAVVFWAIAVILMERTVLARLLRLNERFLEIARQGRPDDRIEPEGSDEITALTQAVNEMLAVLSRANVRLIESEVKYRTIFEISGIATAIVNASGKILLVNAEFARMAGLSRDDIEGKRLWSDFFTGAEGVSATADLPLPGEVPRRRECEFVNAHDVRYQMQFAAARVAGSDTIVIACADISERKRMEEVLKESEDKYRTLVEQSHDAICLLEGDRFIFANHQLGEITGYGVHDLLGLPLGAILHPEDRGVMASTPMQEGGNQIFEARMLTRGGDVRYLDIAMHELPFRGRRVTLGTFRDVTERRVAEERLVKAQERIEQLEQARSASFTAILHEWRSPLATVKHAIDILLEGIDGPLARQQRDRLITAKRNVDRMMRASRELEHAAMINGHAEGVEPSARTPKAPGS